MNKIDASKYLGIGFRTLERYTSEGRVAARRVRGRSGPALDYEESELARFKAELEAEPPVLAEAPESPALAPSSPARAHGGASAALAKVQPQVLAASKRAASESPQVLVPLEVLASLAARLGEAQKKPRVATAEKLLLDLAEAQALTGLSRAHLRAAIASGELAGKRMGRGWKVRRSELLRWIEAMC